MKKMILIWLMLLSQTPFFAQSFSLTGKVVNQNQEPMEFVSAGLFSTDNIKVQQTDTDSLGHFSMQAEKGRYRLVLKQFGKQVADREIVLEQDVELGEIMVNESVELEGVTVAARKKILEQKVDRLVFHVENSTAATGGTALDALKATPTVRVQNDQVSIVGKGEVLVMIDDRLQRMPQEDLANFLRSIPSDQIKSIEVITAPPAKYEAEGNSGLINIKLKTARTNSWNANLGTSYTQKTYASGNVQGLFNYNHNKLALQASVSKGKENLLTTAESKIFYQDALWKQEMRNRSKTDLLSLGLGIDYKLTTKWTTGIKYLGNFINKESSNKPLTTRLNRETGTMHSSIASVVEANNQPEMHGLNWYHTVALDSMGKNMTVDVDYFQYHKRDYRFFEGNELDGDQNMVPNTFFSSTNTNANKIRNYSGKLDFYLPYKWAEISMGGKFSYTHTGNELEVWDHQTGTPVLNTDQSNFFSYKEYNEALYFSTSKKWTKKWETQLGLRMEATQTEGYSKNLDQTNRNHYLRLFPTAYVTYAHNDHHTFSLNYSRRIRRPDFDYLNPFVIRTSPYDYSEGNPFLKPSFMDNLEFSYIHNQKWVNSVYYAQVSDFGQEVSIVDANTNITRSTPLNYANSYQLGFSTYYNFNKWSWWNSFTGFNVNYQQVTSKVNFVESVDGGNGYLYTNNDFTLNKAKTVFCGVNYAWQLPGRYQIFHISTMHMLDISMKVLCFDKKLSVTCVVEDILNSQRPLITYYSNGIRNSIQNYGDTKGFRISVSYKLGNNNMKSKQRDFGNEEERGRAK